ncbi:MAG: hypothetical protein WC716_01495 [Chitinophagaceae bacterium]|jgi:hypothetical protein
MLFARSYRLSTNSSVDAIKAALLGNMFKVHNLDFEIYESDKCIKIIPHAETEKDLKTLPITHVDLEGRGDTTNLKVSYKIRKIDQGGPYLLVTFCVFLLVGAVAFYLNNEPTLSYLMLGIAVVIFGAFWVKMQSGYFDYATKIKNYLKEKAAAK